MLIAILVGVGFVGAEASKAFLVFYEQFLVQEVLDSR